MPTTLSKTLLVKLIDFNADASYFQLIEIIRTKSNHTNCSGFSLTRDCELVIFMLCTSLMYYIFHNLYVLQLVIFIAFILFLCCCHCQLSILVVGRQSLSLLVDLCCQMPSYNCCHRCIFGVLSVFCFHAKVLLLFLFSYYDLNCDYCTG